MNSLNLKLALELAGLFVAFKNSTYSDDKILSKLIRMAERLITGKKQGEERFDFIVNVLKKVRPSMIDSADKLDGIRLKAGVVVNFFRDFDTNDEGIDDWLADQIEGVLGRLGKLSKRLRDKAKEIESIPIFVTESTD